MAGVRVSPSLHARIPREPAGLPSAVQARPVCLPFLSAALSESRPLAPLPGLALRPFSNPSHRSNSITNKGPARRLLSSSLEHMPYLLCQPCSPPRHSSRHSSTVWGLRDNRADHPNTLRSFSTPFHYLHTSPFPPTSLPLSVIERHPSARQPKLRTLGLNGEAKRKGKGKAWERAWACVIVQRTHGRSQTYQNRSTILSRSDRLLAPYQPLQEALCVEWDEKSFTTDYREFLNICWKHGVPTQKTWMAELFSEAYAAGFINPVVGGRRLAYSPVHMIPYNTIPPIPHPDYPNSSQ